MGLHAEVVEQPITDTLEINYMPYAMSVIISRAIPEIDGFLTTDTKGNATVQLSLDLKTGDQPQERIGLAFRLTQSTSTTNTLPSLTLPEGADVQEFMGVGSVL